MNTSKISWAILSMIWASVTILDMLGGKNFEGATACFLLCFILFKMS